MQTRLMTSSRLLHAVCLLATITLSHAEEQIMPEVPAKPMFQYGNFSFDPVTAELGNIWTGHQKWVRITFPYCDANYSHYELQLDDQWVGLADNVTLLRPEDNGGCHGVAVGVQGSHLGRTNVRVSVTYAIADPAVNPCADNEVKEAAYEVVVMRAPKVEQQVFRLGVAGFLVILNFGFGCSLDLQIVKEILRRPFAPALGFCCQYIMMPLVSGV